MLESSKLWDFGSSSSTCLIDSRKAKGCPNKNVWRRHICVTFQKTSWLYFFPLPSLSPSPHSFSLYIFPLFRCRLSHRLASISFSPRGNLCWGGRRGEGEREAKKKRKKRDTSRYDKRQPLFGRLVISLFPLPVFLKGVNNALLLSSYRI